MEDFSLHQEPQRPPSAGSPQDRDTDPLFLIQPLCFYIGSVHLFCFWVTTIVPVNAVPRVSLSNGSPRPESTPSRECPAKPVFFGLMSSWQTCWRAAPWLRLLALPKLCLRLPARGGKKKRKFFESGAHLARLLAWLGTASGMLSAAAATTKKITKEAKAEILRARVVALTEEGQFSKAVREEEIEESRRTCLRERWVDNRRGKPSGTHGVDAACPPGAHRPHLLRRPSWEVSGGNAARDKGDTGGR